MKKALLSSIIIGATILSIGCSKPNTQENVDKNNTPTTEQNSTANDTTTKLTLEQAKDIALKDANLTKDKVSFVNSKLELDNGVEKFDIEFFADNKEYDYEINSTSGEILSSDSDIENYDTSTKITNTKVEVDVEQAKDIALKHANLTKDDVSFVRAELEVDNGVQVYDVEFNANNVEYDYEINATTGEVISFDKD